MLLLLVAASRMIYGMARTDALPRFLAWVYPPSRTPVRAIAIAMVLASCFAATGELALVAGAANFAVYVAFFAICVSLVVLRYQRPDAQRPFRAPLAVGRLPLLPVAGVGLVVLQIANLDVEVLALGAGLFVSGIVGMEVLSLWRSDAQRT
jgi:APA family basic amino acid/polyamine antiporter